ncbi:MAG: Maf family protein [Lactobacillaceae bacterium]|jgi:septum formation protein|nr:Maf family protein [Lactobacillaceae bacterium]
METKDFILASGSPQRKKLLEQIGFVPKKIEVADIDESVKKGEQATAYVKRLALEKAEKVSKNNAGEIVLGSDTVVVVGKKILHKAKDDEEQTRVMELLSGRSHRVITAVCVINKKGVKSLKVVTTKILMKKLTPKEISDYVAAGRWVGCCGFRIEDIEAFVRKIIGSYSGVVGLPLYEAKNMLIGAGVK